VFGIPGDSITAIVIGVLYMKNMNPGPTLFTQNPQNIYAVYLLFIIANIIMIPLGFLCIKVAKRILSVPREILMPIILLFCIVGTFAINNTPFDVGVMLIAGVVAYFLEQNGFPIAPAILGVVLGRHARGELHHVDDQVGRQPDGLLRPPDRPDAGRPDARGLVPPAGLTPPADDRRRLTGRRPGRRPARGARFRAMPQRGIIERICGADSRPWGHARQAHRRQLEDERRARRERGAVRRARPGVEAVRPA
jgi:hypothetical protein